MTKAQLETYASKAYEVARKEANRPKYKGCLQPWKGVSETTRAGVLAMVKWILDNPPVRNSKRI